MKWLRNMFDDLYTRGIIDGSGDVLLLVLGVAAVLLAFGLMAVEAVGLLP